MHVAYSTLGVKHLPSSVCPVGICTVVGKSIHMAGCIKQNGQLLTLANNNLVVVATRQPAMSSFHHFRTFLKA